MNVITTRMRSLYVIPVLPAVLWVVACGRPSTSVDSAGRLVESMNTAYEGRWYTTVTFVQQTIQYRGEAADTSVWYEALSLPGKLRIDIAPIDSGNGLLFANDKRYVFRGNELLFERSEIHPLMVLGFDVYLQEPEITLAKLDSMGFDLSVLQEGEWEGRPVFIVGAEPGDVETRQFWVDRENLYLVRLIKPDGPGERNLVDVRFRNYEALADAWIAPVVEFYVNGRLTLRELYSEIAAGRDLEPDLFDPESWASADRWMVAR